MDKITIEKPNENKKLIDFIWFFFTQKTKTAVKRMIVKGDVKVNGEKVFDNYLLKVGDIVFIYKKFKKVNQNFLKTKINSKIFFQDLNITIIDKPKNLICHEDKFEKYNTLNNFLKKKFFDQKKWDGQNKEKEPVLVNRIDQNTTGLVLCANNKNILNLINIDQDNLKISKVYLAVVHGMWKFKKITLKSFIEQNDKNKMIILDKPNQFSKSIETRFEPIEINNDFSLIKVIIQKAKKHQIRAQLAHLNHLIVGDYKYANQKYFSPYKSQILISNEIIFNFDKTSSLFYLNSKKFCKFNYDEIKLSFFLKKYEK